MLHLYSDTLGSPLISQKLNRQLVPRKGTNESKGAKSSQLELREAQSHHETVTLEVVVLGQEVDALMVMVGTRFTW